MTKKKSIVTTLIGAILALGPIAFTPQSAQAQGNGGGCAPASATIVQNANGQLVVQTGGALHCPAVTGPVSPKGTSGSIPTWNGPPGPVPPNVKCPPQGTLIHVPVGLAGNAQSGYHFYITTPDGTKVTFGGTPSFSDVQAFSNHAIHTHIAPNPNSGTYNAQGYCTGIQWSPLPQSGGVCQTLSGPVNFICQGAQFPNPALKNPPTPATPIPPSLTAFLPTDSQKGAMVSSPGNENYVFTPSCNWMNTTDPNKPIYSFPTAPKTYYTEVLAPPQNGVQIFLRYQITITPNPIIWNYGDGTSSSGDQGAAWPNSCTNQHVYKQVSNGVVVSASQSFGVAASVSWNDGVNINTVNLAIPSLPPFTWTGVSKPVYQIEPVPYS